MFIDFQIIFISGASFLQQLIKLFDKHYTDTSNGKSMDNVLVILANLHNFKVLMKWTFLKFAIHNTVAAREIFIL